MATTTMNGTVDLDDLLGSFAMPDQVQAQAAESSSISVQRIVNAIQALALVAHDLDHLPKLELLHTVDGLIANVPADDRGPIETAINAILKNGADTDKFMQAIPVPAAGPVFIPYSFDDLMAMPPKEWLIDQVIGPGDIGVIYGAPGCGKTFVGINMIVSACTGSQWAGRFGVARPLKVAYCAGEGISGIPARFKAAAEIHGISRLPGFTFYRTIPQLFAESGDSLSVATIKQFVTEWKGRQKKGEAGNLDIVFIDTLSTASIGAKENDNTDMNKVMSYCRWAATELGCAIMLVHHSNKANTAERGATALRGAADSMIEIRRVSEVGTKAVMRCSKLKDGEQWKDQTFDLHAVEDCNSVCVIWDDPSDGAQAAAGAKSADKATLQIEMETYPGQRFTVKRLAEAIDKKENYTRKLLGELESVGLCRRELSKPGKESSRNPWVYFVSAQQGELNGEALGL